MWFVSVSVLGDGDGVGVTDAVQPTTNGDVATFIAVGVAVGGVLVGLVVGVVGTAFVTVAVMRKKQGDSIRGIMRTVTLHSYILKMS